LKIDTTLTVSLIGLVGILFVAIANHRLTFWREREARRVNACQKFNSSIITSLSGLYPVPSNWPSHVNSTIRILESKFPALQAAVTEFRPYVPWYKKRSFDRAWRTYRLGEDGREIDGQDYWQYVPYSGQGYEDGKYIKNDNRLTYKSDFKKNIDKLLSYSK
jgi:hypothetical protein